MNAYRRLPWVFLLAACFGWAAVPRVISVEPPFGKNGDEIVVNGENLDKASVTKMFLSSAADDHEVQIKEQSAGAIRFVIPAKLALGDYNVTLQTGGDAPAILVQPVSCSVVDEEGARKMSENKGKQEVQIIEQEPEPDAAPQKKK
jgi:hypothetical protein